MRSSSNVSEENGYIIYDIFHKMEHCAVIKVRELTMFSKRCLWYIKVLVFVCVCVCFKNM